MNANPSVAWVYAVGLMRVPVASAANRVLFQLPASGLEPAPVAISVCAPYEVMA